MTAAQALAFQNTKVLRLAESKCAKSLDPRLIDGLCFNISAASTTSGREMHAMLRPTRADELTFRGRHDVLRSLARQSRLLVYVQGNGVIRSDYYLGSFIAAVLQFATPMHAFTGSHRRRTQQRCGSSATKSSTACGATRRWTFSWPTKAAAIAVLR